MKLCNQSSKNII